MNCFLYKGDIQEVEFTRPILNRDGTTLFDKDYIKEMDIDYIVEEIIPLIQERNPKISTFMAMTLFMKKVCVKSMGNDELALLVNMEHFASEYKIPPLSAEFGFEDYPIRLVNQFGIIASTKERVKMEDMKQTTSGNSSKPKKKRA